MKLSQNYPLPNDSNASHSTRKFSVVTTKKLINSFDSNILKSFLAEVEKQAKLKSENKRETTRLKRGRFEKPKNTSKESSLGSPRCWRVFNEEVMLQLVPNDFDQFWN